MRMVRPLSVLFSLIAASLACHAEAQTTEELGAWLRAEWERAAREAPDLQLHAFTYRVELPHTLKGAELARLEAALRDKPDHPRRHELAQYRRRAEHGPDVSRYRVWMDGRGRWRINKTFEYEVPVSFVDQVATDSYAWRLAEDTLIVTDPRQEPPSGYDIPSGIGTIRADMKRMFFGLLNSAPSLGMELASYGTTADGWWAIGTVPDAFTIRYEGHWDDEAGRGFVTRAEVVESADSEAVGRSTDLSGWEFLEGPQLWVAGQVSTRTPDGKVKRRLHAESATPFTQQEFREITAIPRHGHSDPLRGEIRLAELVDHRPSHRIARRFAEGGVIESPLRGDAAPRASTIRRVGWVIGTVLLVSALLVLRRKMHHRDTHSEGEGR